jgi:formylglycine-generating enzyme required for sulfatase activity
MARPWVDDADGRYRLELEGNDQAGNALSGKAVEFEVSLRGPEIELEQPSGVGKWHANAVTGRWRVRARARDANGVEQVACELLSGVDESSTAIALEPEAGSSRSEKVFDGALLLPYTLSDERVRLRFTASDGHGTKTVWTSEELELPSIARPRPERIAVQFGGRDVEPMRLVRGNAEYPYLFGGRGDAIENSAFVRAGVGPFNSSPRKSRTRSWQIEYSAGAIEDFYLDEREVSVSQYLAFVRDPGGYADARNWREDGPDSARVEELGADLAELPGDRPVTNVTWPEASAYARWVHKRLPAWVEWEFAVRGGGEYRISSAQDPSVGEWMEAAKSSAPLSRGNSGDWTPDEKLADLCANVAEWTSTAASFESEDDRRYPHRWARAHPERLLPQATADEGIEYWIAGGSYMDQRFDFAVVDYRPSRFAHPAIGFRCAVSLRDVQASLGQAVAGGPFFEEAP